MTQSLLKTFSASMEALGPFEKEPHIAVAVSGGMDSLALTFLAEAWVRKQNGKLTLFHVNHGLRKASTEEAEKVSKWMKSRGHTVHVLSWNPSEQPTTRIQERARHARYNLLDRACQKHNILHLLTGHHKDDDIETFLMRKEKKSSDYGLAGMSRLTYLAHCRLLRPLLSISKKNLETVIEDHPYIEDPSNKNTSFKRAALREQGLPHQNMAPFKEKRQEDEAYAISFLAKT
ncbi:MAG: tRNA lysidine(34) synthetase TilS [Holosporaceae bacterium]|nr:MAG: tRNA lysidine(34) synthetase TilS [Holosporaceae bacterium]